MNKPRSSKLEESPESNVFQYVVFLKKSPNYTEQIQMINISSGWRLDRRAPLRPNQT